MTNWQLPPEFEHLFSPRKIGSEDPTLNLPVIQPDAITQEIRGDTLRIPIVETTAEQPMVAPESPGYIAPTPRKEPEHQTGTRPSNTLLGIAFSIAVGIIAMVAFSHNVTTPAPPREHPRAEQSTLQRQKPTTKPPVEKRQTSPSSAPIVAIPAQSSSPSPQKSSASALTTPSVSSIPSPAATTVAPTMTTTPSITPTAAQTPPQASPTETSTDQSSAAPSEQPSVPPTAPTP